MRAEIEELLIRVSSLTHTLVTASSDARPLTDTEYLELGAGIASLARIADEALTECDKYKSYGEDVHRHNNIDWSKVNAT